LINGEKKSKGKNYGDPFSTPKIELDWSLEVFSWTLIPQIEDAYSKTDMYN
jgi:hypothetical protein